MSESPADFGGYVQKGDRIKVTWSMPAEILGKEIMFSNQGDQGTFEGVEGEVMFIRRDDGTLNNYPLSSIRGIEAIS